MKALIILGPTAIGKSQLGLELASTLDGEIISIDSRQIYKKLDIGTAKPTREERERIPHHLIDIISIEKKPDAEWFADIARDSINDVQSRDKLPILVAGSGLYLRAVIEGLFRIDLDKEARDTFAMENEDIDTKTLYNHLKAVDPESGERIHSNDRYRILRALEVYKLSGITLSEHFKRQKSAHKDPGAREYIKIGLTQQRKELHGKIKQRTISMVEAGWVGEVEELLEEGADASWPGMRTLGYPEVVQHIKGKLPVDEMIEKISTLTRQYAKRQMTWFRKERNVDWLNMEDADPVELIMKKLDATESSW